MSDELKATPEIEAMCRAMCGADHLDPNYEIVTFEGAIYPRWQAYIPKAAVALVACMTALTNQGWTPPSIERGA